MKLRQKVNLQAQTVNELKNENKQLVDLVNRYAELKDFLIDVAPSAYLENKRADM